jgi:hypothetical protein
MSPKKERVTHYVLRYGDGNASLIRVIWSSAEEDMPAYIEANAVLKPRRLWEKLQNNAAMPHLPVQPMMQHSADVDLCISLVASAQNSFVRKLLSISTQVHITFVFIIMTNITSCPFCISKSTHIFLGVWTHSASLQRMSVILFFR